MYVHTLSLSRLPSLNVMGDLGHRGTVLFTLTIVLISASMLKKEYRSDLTHSVGKV